MTLKKENGKVTAGMLLGGAKSRFLASLGMTREVA
jgi:hypothetical protein